MKGPSIAFGLSWGHGKGRKDRIAAALTMLLLGALVLVPPAAHAAEPVPASGSVIIRAVPGSTDSVATAVLGGGGTVNRTLAIIDGLAADVSIELAADLAARRDVLSITPDYPVTLQQWEVDKREKRSGGWIQVVTTKITDADHFWDRGFTGAGIDVAVIDSGMVPVAGLTGNGKVVNAIDLSFESQSDVLRHLDTFGHGTHIAGIIAGKDDGLRGRISKKTKKNFVGMAPDARLINIKVADANGAVDVSQVIAAVDWVVQHRTSGDLDIRVLNLSFGTDGTQDYRIDPLAFAVETAWHAGIVVVVAAGNDGRAAALRNPAIDPYVIAVGAVDAGTSKDTDDDVIPNFSSCGTGDRHVDVVAPGKSVVSLRAPGSNADLNHPDARVANRLFRGSGTSQAAAVVSGAAALIIDQRPDATPDQVKALLMDTARPLETAAARCQGAGLIDLQAAFSAATPETSQAHARATGTGSLEGARGSAHVTDAGTELRGEQDIFGTPWDSKSWSQASAAGKSWSGGDWNGKSWSGNGWTSKSWSGKSWSGIAWESESWAGISWSNSSWAAKSWSSDGWSAKSWSAKSWSAKSWSAKSWSAHRWD